MLLYTSRLRMVEEGGNKHLVFFTASMSRH